MRPFIISSMILAFLPRFGAYDVDVGKCDIRLRVQTANCLMAGSNANMTLYYASLVSTDVFRDFNHSAVIGTLARLDVGVRLKATDTSDVFEKNISCLGDDLGVKRCLNAPDVGPCLPAGDAFFIDFNPAGGYFDGWSPTAIHMELLYEARHVSYKRVYEFVNVFRCDAWIEQRGVYQLGPRHGLIIRHETLPNVGDWVRTWV